MPASAERSAAPVRRLSANPDAAAAFGYPAAAIGRSAVLGGIQRPAYRASSRLNWIERDDCWVVYDAHHLAPLRIEKAGWDAPAAFQRIGTFVSEAECLDKFGSLELVEFFARHGLVEKTSPSFGVSRDAGGAVCAPGAAASFSLTVLVQHSCNFGCVYCLNGPESYQTSDKSSVSIDHAKAVIRSLRRSAPDADASIYLSFFGGEPLLGWKKVIDIAEFPRVAFNITSNLSLLPQPIVDLARRHRVTFCVNVDGPAPVHNKVRPFVNGRPSYDTVVANVRRLCDAGADVQLRMLVCSHNEAHIHETVDLHREIGAPVSLLTPLRGANSDATVFGDDLYATPKTVRSQVEALLRSRSDGVLDFYPAIEILNHIDTGTRVKQYCGADVQGSPIVDNKGNLYNCVWFVGNERFRMGAITESGMMLENEPNERFQSLNGIRPEQACARCNYREVCGGPCPATRIMDLDAALFERERQLKCAMTKPITDFLMEGLVNGRSFRSGYAGTIVPD